MKLLELRFDKAGLVEKIMQVVDSVAMGGSPVAAKMFAKMGIDVTKDPDEVRKDLLIMDEFQVAQLHRALVGAR